MDPRLWIAASMQDPVAGGGGGGAGGTGGREEMWGPVFGKTTRRQH